MRPIANDPSNGIDCVVTPIGNENSIVPEAAVLSYPITVPVVVHWNITLPRSPAPVLHTVVVAVDM